jgi:hypothetical protein
MFLREVKGVQTGRRQPSAVKDGRVGNHEETTLGVVNSVRMLSSMRLA